MPKYGVISGPYFPVFGLNIPLFSPNKGKYGPEITPYLDTFHAVGINRYSCGLFNSWCGMRITFLLYMLGLNNVHLLC